MSWRLAGSLIHLQQEINSGWPNRDKSADGTIGDAAHASQGSASDHNPWVTDSNGEGVVRAFDITADPQINPAGLAEHLRQLGQGGDPRLNNYGYVIYNSQIAGYSNDGSRWDWRAYDGDPHTSHIHLSVSRMQSQYDDTSSWNLTQEDWLMAGEAQQILAAIADLKTTLGNIGALLEGRVGPDGKPVDATHDSLLELDLKIDRLIAKVGA